MEAGKEIQHGLVIRSMALLLRFYKLSFERLLETYKRGSFMEKINVEHRKIASNSSAMGWEWQIAGWIQHSILRLHMN